MEHINLFSNVQFHSELFKAFLPETKPRQSKVQRGAEVHLKADYGWLASSVLVRRALMAQADYFNKLLEKT